ncbi:MAG TPA: outer membrane protein assembly factor BamA [Vicinamibacterales bacterium]|nr:outer membrane protein assembly factor BamA [Vicinamibacterales bacterium]
MRRLTFRLLALGLLVCALGCKEDERGGVEVADLSFDGIHAVSEGQLKSVLATAESAFLPWGTKRYFSRQQFEADLKRIEAFYADRGYPDAQIKSFDVRLSQDQTSVKITITIDEGQPLRVERLVFEGFEPLPDEREQALRDQLPLQAGTPLDRALLQAGREAALDELRDQGHPYAKVHVTESAGSSERLRVVTLRAEPGEVARFGPIEISGNSSVEDRVVRRQLWFRPGQLFQQSRLRESQRRLYGLELFQFVNVEPVGLDEQAPEIPIRVTVTEGKHRKVNFSAGYGSEEKARGEVDWRHVNFFGGARTAGVTARYSALDGGVRLNFDQPYLFSPRYSLGLSGQAWHTNEPAFELTTSGGRATVTRQFRRTGGAAFGRRPTTTVALTYINEWEWYKISEEARNDPTFRDELIALGLNPETGEASGRLSALSIDAARNTTENLLNATRGYIASLHLEQAGRWMGGDFNYTELTGEGRVYQTIGSRLVVALRARAGSISSAGDEDTMVPFFKRYFLGGATTLRGWGRYEVSPLGGDGEPVGGHSFVNFSTEVRVPLFGRLSAVLFLDGGNVWSDPWNFNLDDLRYDVGPGLRYDTPVGPFRLDVGYQLNPIPGLIINGEEQTRPLRFHFSIGQAF